MNPTLPVHVIGDVHGHFEKLARILRETDLIDAHGDWRGGQAQLWLMGDFTDRGPDGIGVIDIVMRLEHQARAAGGGVHSILGNHELALLSAYLFPAAKSSGPAGTFFGDWARYSGLPGDLERLQPHHVEWMQELPALAHVNDRLLLHADALFYANYGRTVAQVNRAFKELLHGADTPAWNRLMGEFAERLAFEDRRADGVDRALKFLELYGGAQLVHGHTPIRLLSGEPDEKITRAFVYANGLCVNVDGGMYRGGPGFAYALQSLPARASVVAE